MEKIKIPELTLEELDMIVESLNSNYGKLLRKAQRHSGERSVKISQELSLCQTVMQELTTIANYARQEKASDPDGSTILY